MPRSLLTAPQSACGDPWHSQKVVGGWQDPSRGGRGPGHTPTVPAFPPASALHDKRAVEKEALWGVTASFRKKGVRQRSLAAAPHMKPLASEKKTPLALSWAPSPSPFQPPKASLNLPGLSPLQAPASSLAVWSKPWLCHSLAQGSWAHDFPTPNLNFLRKTGRDSGVWIPEMT